MSFSRFYLLKEMIQLDKDFVILESTEKLSLRDLKKLGPALISHFGDQFPKVQFKDLEDAFFKSIEQIKKNKFEDKKLAKNYLKKIMKKEIEEISSSKKKVKKDLSCVKTIKNSLGKELGEKISTLISRADKILTNQEKKILSMCTQGKSVRQMALELKFSAPSTWRVLNSAIDKIRLSHGLRSRYKDIRK